LRRRLVHSASNSNFFMRDSGLSCPSAPALAPAVPTVASYCSVRASRDAACLCAACLSAAAAACSQASAL
jgi:hypothetical protein